MNDIAETTNRSPDDEEIDLFLSSAREIISLINKIFPTGELPVQDVTRTVIVNSKVKNENEKHLNQWFFKTENHKWNEEYYVLGTLEEYIKYMLEKADIDFSLLTSNSVQYENMDTEERIRYFFHFTENLVLYPILDCICGKLSLDISGQELIDSYLDYSSPWKRDAILRKRYTPLLAFTADTELFEFNDEFSLLLFPDDLKTAFNNTTGYTFTNEYSMHELCESTHMIYWKREYARKDKPYRGDHPENLYLLIMCLRISNSSEVVAKFSFHNVSKRISIIGNGGYWHFETSKPHIHGDPAKFTEDDLVSARDMFQKLLVLKANKGYKSIFNVVVNRFLSSLSRPSPEDSVIDLTICLESLLLFGVKDELTFRLSLRGAVLLDSRNPTDTKRLLAQMYRDRSNIVHNGDKLHELRGNKSRICLQKYRLITEQIIAAYISKSDDFSSIEKLNQYIDNLCLNSGQPALCS